MGNGTGIAGMILGIIACILSVIVIGFLAGLILGIIALILSILGIAKNDKKAFGIVGLIFSLIAIVLGLYWLVVIAVWWGRSTA